MKRSRIAPRSEKRITETEARHAVRELTLWRAGNKCQAIGVIPGHRCRFLPSRPQLEVHERIPRSTYPGGHLDPDNTLALCPDAHDWVSDNPTAAHELGLHGFSWERTQGDPPQ